MSGFATQVADFGWGLGPIFVTGMARTVEDRLHALLEPEIQGLGYELLLAEYVTGSRPVLRLYIDGPDGIGVDDCEAVSHQVSGLLDVEDPLPGKYQLEVSSPGFDRPLVTSEHFEQFAGEEIKLTLAVPLDGRRRFRGVLRGVESDCVVLELESGVVKLSIAAIQRARVVPRVG